jgi:hypothetical protein
MSADAYVRCVLDLYRSIPETPNRARPADRRLAATLYQQGVPLDIVAAAFILATARRHYRDPGAPALSSVRSLHYYLPVIDEMLADPPPWGYRQYLLGKLATHAPELVAAINHQKS